MTWITVTHSGKNRLRAEHPDIWRALWTGCHHRQASHVIYPDGYMAAHSQYLVPHTLATALRLLGLTNHETFLDNTLLIGNPTDYA
jgi:hypothetical protein